MACMQYESALPLFYSWQRVEGVWDRMADSEWRHVSSHGILLRIIAHCRACNPHQCGMFSQAMSVTEPACDGAHGDSETPSLRSMIQGFLPCRDETPPEKKTPTIATSSTEPAGISDIGVASSSSGSRQDVGLKRDRSTFWQWMRVRSSLREISPPPRRKFWTASDLRDYLKQPHVLARGPLRPWLPLHVAPVNKKLKVRAPGASGATGRVCSKGVHKRPADPSSAGAAGIADVNDQRLLPTVTGPVDVADMEVDDTIDFEDSPPADPSSTGAPVLEDVDEDREVVEATVAGTMDAKESVEVGEGGRGRGRVRGRGGSRARGRGSGGRGGDIAVQEELGGGGHRGGGGEGGGGRDRGKGRGGRGGGGRRGRGRGGAERGRGDSGRGGQGVNVQSARFSFIARYMEEHGQDRRAAAQAWLTSVERQQLIDTMGHAEAKRRKLI